MAATAWMGRRCWLGVVVVQHLDVWNLQWLGDQEGNYGAGAVVLVPGKVMAVIGSACEKIDDFGLALNRRQILRNERERTTINTQHNQPCCSTNSSITPIVPQNNLREGWWHPGAISSVETLRPQILLRDKDIFRRYVPN